MILSNANYYLSTVDFYYKYYFFSGFLSHAQFILCNVCASPISVSIIPAVTAQLLQSKLLDNLVCLLRGIGSQERDIHPLHANGLHIRDAYET